MHFLASKPFYGQNSSSSVSVIQRFHYICPRNVMDTLFVPMCPSFRDPIHHCSKVLSYNGSSCATIWLYDIMALHVALFGSIWHYLLHVALSAPCGSIYLLHVALFASCGSICFIWLYLLHVALYVALSALCSSYLLHVKPMYLCRAKCPAYLKKTPCSINTCWKSHVYKSFLSVGAKEWYSAMAVNGLWNLI